MMRRFFQLLVVLGILLVSFGIQAADGPPRAVFTETIHTFEPVVEGGQVTHAFVFQNQGEALLKITDIKSG